MASAVLQRSSKFSADPVTAAPSAAASGRTTQRRQGCGPAALAVPAAVATLAMALLLLALHSPIGAQGQAYLPATMIDAMESAMFLNRFMDAADVTGYYDRFLDANFSGTVFAPVDLGFDALLQRTNATWDEFTSPELNETLSGIVGLHVVPGTRLFPLSVLREGLDINTASGAKLYVRRDVPGIVHVYAVPRPEDDPLNYATVLQYQEIRGGKAILYVVDKVLLPVPKTAAPPAGAQPSSFVRRNRAGGASAQRKA